MKKYDEYFKTALKKWGYDAQIKICIEELAELIVELSKIDRYKNGSNVKDVVSEIADVKIMIRQMEFIFSEKLVKDSVEYKMNRLKRLLNNG